MKTARRAAGTPRDPGGRCRVWSDGAGPRRLDLTPLKGPAMSLIELFHSTRASSAIRRLDTSLDFAARDSARAAARLEQVAQNVGELNLLMLVTVRALLDKGIVTYEDIGRYFAQIDAIDGKADAKITLEDVRNALGLRPAAGGA